MKKNLLTAVLVLGVAAGALAQGTVTFQNFATGTFKAPIYGVQADNAALHGQSAAGLPAGTVNYTGGLLTGTGFTAQLWSAPGAVTDANSLQAALPTSAFRTGGAAGFFNLATVTLPNVPADAPLATLQVRVWDNAGGTITDWASAATKGASDLFQVSNIGGNLNTPPSLNGMTSFNLTSVPEPGTFALAGLGAAALLIFRRRK